MYIMLTYEHGARELLAARITALRERLGLSMRAFGHEVGVSHPTQSRIEHATRTPDADYLRCLAERFDVNLNDLLGSKSSGSLCAQNFEPQLEPQAAGLLAAWRAANDDGKRLIEQTASFVAHAARRGPTQRKNRFRQKS